MSPYIGILIDSFWEAVGNKVLWALLIGWSILLICLAPFGYVSERSFQLSAADISNRSQLVEKLTRAAKGQGPAAAQAVAKQLDPEFLERLRQSSGSDSGLQIKASKLAEELNVAVSAKQLYDPNIFPTAERRKRLQPLIEAQPDNLDEAGREELNRELMQLAFPLELNRPRGEQLWIGYAGFKLGSPLAISRRQIREYIEPLALQIIIKLGLGILAVFVAIIVTSPIIPDTFRSGSLHLLLSKPISRVWLYLSKFFGGTIFVLVNITFVLVGLYLIAGTRFDIWNSGLLLCIPLLLFVFVIFYSVSGLAGLLWGNAIVCVVSCMIFWFCCFCLGFAKGSMQPHVEIYPQINKVREIEDNLTTITENGQFNVWNERFSLWQPAIDSNGGGSQSLTFGPIYDARGRQILVKSFMRNPFGAPFARDRKLSIVSLDSASPSATQDQAEDQAEDQESTQPNEAREVADPDPTAGDSSDQKNENMVAEDALDEQAAATSTEDLTATQSGTATVTTDDEAVVSQDKDAKDGDNSGPSSAREARDTALWDFDAGPEIPAQLFDLVELNEQVIAVCRGGLYRLNLEQVKLLEASEKALLGLFKLPAWASSSAFQNIAPKDYFLSENSNAAATQDGQGLIVFSSGNLDFLKLTDQGLEIVSTAKLDGDADNTEAALVQMNTSFCVVARDGLPLKILDSELQPVTQVALPKDAKVKQMVWIPGSDQLSIVTHAGILFRLDCQQAVIEPMQLPISADVSCIHWIDEQQAYLATKPNSVYKIDFGTQEVVDSFVPSPTTLESVYRYGVNPLYRLLPKPAALDDAMLYLLTGNETQSMSVITNDLEAAQLELDVWTPILSNLAFVIVVLGISCIYIARKEF